MPQKKNADLLELVRGKAARVIGAATTLLVAMKGLPLAYNKDMQETQEPLFDAAQAVRSTLPLVTGWMKQVEFDFARMQAAGVRRDKNAIVLTSGSDSLHVHLDGAFEVSEENGAITARVRLAEGEPGA